MLAEIIDIKANEIELKLQEEDISIMYIIQHELLKEKNVQFAGVMLKHPLIKDYILRVISNKNSPIEAVQRSSISALEYIKEVASICKVALKNELMR